MESLKLDYSSQIRELGNIHNKKICDDCIYVGSGDSYVAGLIVEFLTDHKCKCYSPSDLLNSKLMHDKTYCFISVTGKTRANIEVARQAARDEVRTVAVTSNKKSKLAEICNETVPLELKRTKSPIVGFDSFIRNVVTCLQLAGVAVPQEFDIWYNNGVELSRKFLDSNTVLDGMEDTMVFLLGNNMLYPLALYTSLKLTEFFGTTAVAHKLEEFCHSPLFGVKKSHQLWILGQNEETVIQKLSRLGLKLSYIELYNQDFLSELFESIFFVQNLMILLAEKYGYTELNYLRKKDVLKASSDVIYSD